jgi:hypothetical protein
VSEFENFAVEASQIESTIARLFVALGIDLDDAVQVRQLAREAIQCGGHGGERNLHDPEVAARVELFGMAQLMLTVMRESALERQVETHGGPYWKAFARALWAEHSGAEHPDTAAPSDLIGG